MAPDRQTIPHQHIIFLRAQLIDWWVSLPEAEKEYPWRLQSISQYQALATEVLLQRTRAKSVLKVFDRFFDRFPNAASLGKARVQTIENVIRPLGLAWRAQKLKALGKEVGRGIPDSFEELIKLPGVGPYAAGAYLSLHQGIRATIPDANVVRILCRFFGYEYGPETRRNKEFLSLLDEVTPSSSFREFNYGLIDFGKNICLPRNPFCAECILNACCCCYWQLTSD